MKEKRKIIILDRVIRRFKKMCGAFIILSGLQYFLSYTLKSVKDLQIEENENEFGSFFTVEAASKINPIMLEDIKLRGEYCDKNIPGK